MTDRGRRCRWALKTMFPLLLPLAPLALVASVASAEEVYTATLTSPKGLAKKKTATLTVTIHERTTEADAEKLRKVYDEGGSDAFFEAVRQFDQGLAKITGGVESPIRFVRVYPGQNGVRVVIITDGPLYFPEDTPDVLPKGPLGIIHMVVTNAGTGRGALASAVKLRVTREGTYEVEAAQNAPIDLEDVKQVK